MSTLGSGAGGMVLWPPPHTNPVNFHTSSSSLSSFIEAQTETACDRLEEKLGRQQQGKTGALA